MLQAAFDFEGAPSAPAAARKSRRRKPAPGAPVAPPTWMASNLIHPPGPTFLAADNFHHDRPDDTPTCLTGDPRRSPRFGTLAAAERAVRRFPAPEGMGWLIQPTETALMYPSVVGAFLERAGLPRQSTTWGIPNDVGTFAVETVGRAGRDLSFRVTYSHSNREFATLHDACGVLSRCYRARLESVPLVGADGKQYATLTTAVVVTGVLPPAEWYDPRP